LILIGSLISTNADKHYFSVNDMVQFDRLASLVPNSMGSKIAFTKWIWNTTTHVSSTHVYVLDLTNTTAKPFDISTNNPGMQYTDGISDQSPTWSPDGNCVAFIRNGQIYVSDLSSNPVQLSYFGAGATIGNLKWSPSGTYIAFTAEVYPGHSINDTLLNDLIQSNAAEEYLLFDKLFIRHWASWHNPNPNYGGAYRRQHIFLLPVVSNGTTWTVNGSEFDLLTTEDSDSPVKPFGGIEQFDFAPNTNQLAYTLQKGNNSSIAWSTDLNVYTVNWDSTGTQIDINCITCDNNATDEQPAYSPDGRYIAYLKMTVAQYESDRRQIILYDTMNKTFTSLTPTWPYSPESLYWADSNTIYFTVQINATSRVYSISVNTSMRNEITNTHHTSSVFVIGNNIIYAQDSFQAPSNFFMANLTNINNTVRTLTDFNDAKLAAIVLVATDQFTFNGWNNETVQAWVFKPAGFQAGTKYPLAFIIHGGPQSAILDAWSFRWNPQAWTGNNYSVVIVNFHGSSSFGQSFTDSIQGDWGGKPFQDLMLGLDAALKAYDWIDSDRVCALGASYGGYMINWINSQLSPGKFKCLVVHDGVFSTDGSYYTTEEIFFDEHEFQGIPYERQLVMLII